MKHNDNRVVLMSSPKLVAKETSEANSSSRVYYGAAAGAVPFVWESQPGTPKHTLSETCLPPLTPPPSYSLTIPTHSSSSLGQISNSSSSRAKAILRSIFPKSLMRTSRNMSTPTSSVSWSSSSSSSWSSTSSSKGTLQHKQRYSVSSSRVPFACYDDEEDGDDEDLRRSGSPSSTLCFGIKRRANGYFRSCNSVRKIKFAFTAIPSYDQSRRGRTI